VRYCREKTSLGLHPAEKNAAVLLDQRSEVKQFTIVIALKFSATSKITRQMSFVAFFQVIELKQNNIFYCRY